MTLTASIDERAVDGLSTLLADEITGFAVRPDPGDATVTGLFPGKLPTVGGQAVAVMPYLLSAASLDTETELGVQFTIRSAADDVRACWAIDAAIRDRLLGRYPLVLGNGLRINTLRWASGTSLGQDGQRRWLRTSNFTLRVFDPTSHRL